MRNRIVLMAFAASVLAAAYAASGDRHEKIVDSRTPVDRIVVEEQSAAGVIIPVAGIHRSDLRDKIGRASCRERV